MKILLVGRGDEPFELEPHLRRHGVTSIVDDALWRLHRALRRAREFRPDVVVDHGTTGVGAILSVALDIPLLSMRGRGLGGAVDTRRFHTGVDGAETRLRYGLDGQPVIAYAGGFDAGHAVAALVDAARAVGGEARWLFAGDGPLRPVVQRRAFEAGIADRCVFTGDVPAPALPGVLAAADVCVVADRRRVFESLALGKPTITARTSLPQTFRDGIEVRFAPLHDPDALADVVRRTLDPHQGAATMAAAGRARVLAAHSLPAQADHLVTLMRSLLEAA